MAKEEELIKLCQEIFGFYLDDHARASAALSLLDRDERFSREDFDERVQFFRDKFETLYRSILDKEAGTEPTTTIRVMLEVLQSRKK